MTDNKFIGFAKKNWGLLSVLFLTVVVLVWFASRLFLDFLYFNDPRNVDVELKPWMTPRFIVLTYDVPRSLVFEILDLDETEDRGIRLGRVAQERGLSLEDLTVLVRDEIAAYRKQVDD